MTGEGLGGEGQKMEMSTVRLQDPELFYCEWDLVSIVITVLENEA